MPALRARKRLAAMAPGARLLIRTTDPLATLDIPAMLAEEGHALVATERDGEGHRFVAERGGPGAR